MADMDGTHVPVVVIRVSDPEQRDGRSYVTFKISTFDSSLQTEDQSKEQKEAMELYPANGSLLTTTFRRYSDFVVLHELLTAQYPGCLIPPIPDKVFHLTGGLTAEELKERTDALHVFLARVALHPILAMSAALQDFIYNSEKDSLVQLMKCYKPVLASGEEVFMRCQSACQYELQSKHGYSCDQTDMHNYNPTDYYSTLIGLMALDGVHQQNELNSPLSDAVRCSTVTTAKHSLWNLLSTNIECMQQLITNRLSHGGLFGEKEMEQCKTYLEECYQKNLSLTSFLTHAAKQTADTEKSLQHLALLLDNASQKEALHSEQSSSLALGVQARAASQVSIFTQEKQNISVFLTTALKDQQRWIKAAQASLQVKEPMMQYVNMGKAVQVAREKLLTTINLIKKEKNEELLPTLPSDAIDDTDMRVHAALKAVLELEFLARRQKKYIEALTSQLLIELTRFRCDYSVEVRRVVTTVAEWNQKWCVHREAVWTDALLV